MQSHLTVKFLILFFCVLVLCSAHARAQYPGFDAPGMAGGTSSSAGITPVEAIVDGGAVTMGGTAQVVVRFRNDGGQPVQTGQINLYPSSNVTATISMDQCSKEPLQAGAECALAVSVKGLQSGPWRAELLMLHTGRSRLVTATLTGTVDAAEGAADRLSSDIEAIPDEVDFGSLTEGQTMVEPVILRNITSNPIKISEIAINAGEQSGLTVAADCEELMAGEACMATVTWSPKAKGPSSGALVVKHNGPTGVASVGLKGEYTPGEVEKAQLFPDAVPGKGLLISSQDNVDFGGDVATASTITVSLVNVGDSAITLKDIKVAGTNNGLNLSSAGCSANMKLQPIEACPLTVTWSPTRIGNLIDDIQVLHDGARGVLVLPVRGISTGTVSQDQKAIVLSSSASSESTPPTEIIGNNDVMSDAPEESTSRSAKQSSPQKLANASSALDGLRITSFASTRAIVNGPGGSRLVHNGEQVMLGGVVWDVTIQKNGIEFANGADNVLLLFDRSLSSASGGSGGKSGGGAAVSSASDITAPAQ